MGTSRYLVHGLLLWKRLPGVTRHLIGTRPSAAWMSRASSVHGSRPPAPWLFESITWTVPRSVLNVVSSTLLSGR